MPEIKIKVRDKCAEGEGVIICNNSDYTVVWDLDSEWEPYSTRTMRVNLADGTYQDAVFTGNSAPLPVLTASGWVSVGLYAGDLHTSRAARLLALSSVLTPVGSPAAPAEDVYAQIMAKLNELSTVSPEDIAKAVEDYLAEHPAASASMRVEGGYIQFSGDGETWENVIALADLKGPKGDTGAGMDVTGATVGQIAKIAAVDDNGVPTAWEPVYMPSGGGETWELINEVTLSEDAMAVVFDKDKSGAAFALRKFVVVGHTKGSNASNTGGGVICINTANTPDDRYSIVPPSFIHGALKGDQLRYWHAAAEIIAENGWRWYLTGADNTVRVSTITIGTALSNVTKKIPKVATYLSLWSRTSGSAFAAGSKIELYGVRV